MRESALLLSDVVDSTALVERLGDAAAAGLWAAHDQLARDLLPAFGGREIDKTDGFLLLFETVGQGLGFAAAYHRGLERLSGELGVELRARVGLHWAPVVLREIAAEHVARGAKPLEVEGIAKPTAARIMSLAAGGQTVLSASAAEQAEVALGSIGHWRLKGTSQPLELFAVTEPGGAPVVPPDASKAWRVVQREGRWLPVREVPHNLPLPADLFVGRGRMLGALARRLEDASGIVTLVGPGGVGKTRTSLEVAARTLGAWPGGAWFVELETVRDGPGLLSAVARTFGQAVGGADPVGWLAGLLRERGRMLVVLDNFEQLVARGASVLERLAALSPEVCWLVSSREGLHVRGEQLVVLDCLELPEVGAPVEVLRRSPALQLFVERAERVKPGFAAGEAGLRAAAELVTVLEGLPLALELAAARARLMSPQKMLERVSERFRLLARGRRGAPRRQATLRGAIDWSWDLLAPWERHALVQCAVFAGGFTVEAAEAVVDLSVWPDAPYAEDAIQALLDKSLLRTWQPAEGEARHGLAEPLLGMYVSIHEYAAEKLHDTAAVAGPEGEALSGPEPAGELRLRHAAWFLRDVDERLEEANRAPQLLDLEREDLLLAFDTAAEVDRELALGGLLLLDVLARRIGPFTLLTDRAHRVGLEVVDGPLAAKAAKALSHAHERQGQLEPAERLLRAVEAWAGEAGERQLALGAAHARLDLGYEGGWEPLAELHERALAEGFRDEADHIEHNLALREARAGHGGLARRRLEGLIERDAEPAMMARHNLGCLYIGDGRFDEALVLAEEVEQHGLDEDRVIFAMLGATNQGLARLAMGDLEAAERLLQRGLERATAMGFHRFRFGGAAWGLATVEVRTGRLDAAAARLARVLPMTRALGDGLETAWVLSAQVELQLAREELDAALETFAEIDEVAPDWRGCPWHQRRFVQDAADLLAAAGA